MITGLCPIYSIRHFSNERTVSPEQLPLRFRYTMNLDNYNQNQSRQAQSVGQSVCYLGCLTNLNGLI